MIKIMVVEDEDFVRKGIITETDWSALGCQVVAEASNGEEGLTLAQKACPDLIISDIRMPRLDGISMLRKLREEGNLARVIFLTAYSEFSYAQEALRLMAADYLLKPFEDGELEAAVKRVCLQMEEAKEKEPVEKDAVLAMVESVAEKSSYVRETIAYINMHYGNMNLSVGAIANELGISEGHLSHLFKKETTCTIMTYITRYRICRAKELLADCRSKVYEVAEQVGYRDITYFSSTFKKIVGTSPSEYQRRKL